MHLGDIVIHLYGDLSLEGQKKLSIEINEIKRRHPHSKITLDLKQPRLCWKLINHNFRRITKRLAW